MTNAVSAVLKHSLRHRVAGVRAGSRLAVAIAVSGLTALLLPSSIVGEIRAVASWDAFAATALILTWTTILTLQPEQICVLAKREDPSRLASLILVICGAGAALLAVLVLLQSSMKMTGAPKTQAIVLALSAVVLAWFLIHTVFTMRYAHEFHDAPADKPPLEFPGLEDLPDYLDFAYFAFVIGMTAQTADVNIHGRDIRRTALLHGIIAFAFNTAVVALSIGILTTLL
jgi:uncharacterized membrane protein